MKKTLVIVIIALLCSSMFPILVCADPTPMVYVDSSTVTAEVGETFDVNIMISEFSNLWSWQAGLQWDGNILQVVSYAWGDFRALVASGYTFQTNPLIDLDNNVMTWPPAMETAYGLYTTAPSSTTPVKLLTLTFHAIAAGTCTISLTNVALRGQDPTTTTAYYRWCDVWVDNKVNILDFVQTHKAYWTASYNSTLDYDNDGAVDVTDIAIVMSNFGKVYTDPSWGITRTIYPITATLQDFSVNIVPDTSPPITTLYLSGTQGVPPWFTGPVTVTLTATDRSGIIAGTAYSFDSLTWITYTGPFVILDEGATSVYYYSTDGAGNVEATKSEIVRIDTSVPVITIASPSARDYPQFRTLAISFGATDAVSGLASVIGALGYDPARIYVDPPTRRGIVGQSYTFNVWIDQVVDLYCWQIKMYFDPTILECTNVIIPQDNVFAGRQVIVPTPVIDNDAGTLAAGAALLGMEPGFSGSGKLTQIEFSVKNEGSSALTFDPNDTFLLDQVANSIPFTAEAGFFTSGPFNEEHDVAITNVTASPMVVTAGEQMVILVDVQNQGTLSETAAVTVYYDSNAIATQTVGLLPFDDPSTLTFSWDTSSVPMGLYEIRAEASPVPGETDLSDNILVDSVISVRMPVTSGQAIDLSTLKLGKYTLTVTAVDNGGNVVAEAVTFSIVPPAHANVEIVPKTLSVNTKTKFIAAYIELPAGLDVNNIEVSSILLNDTIAVAPSTPATVGDYDADGIPDLMVKFDAAAVMSYVLTNVDMTKLVTATATLTVTGYLNDGTGFQGSDTITIIRPRGGKGSSIPV